MIHAFQHDLVGMCVVVPDDALGLVGFVFRESDLEGFSPETLCAYEPLGYFFVIG
jgi:hypothetical protein